MVPQSERGQDWDRAGIFLARHLPPPDASGTVDVFRNDNWDVQVFGPSDWSGDSVLFQKIPGEEGLAVEFTEAQGGELRARVEPVGANISAMHAVESRLGASATQHLMVESVLPQAGSVTIIGKNQSGDLHQAVEVFVGPRPSAMPTTVRR